MSFTRRNFLKIAGLGTVGAAAAVLAACGSDSGSASDSAATPSSSAAPETGTTVETTEDGRTKITAGVLEDFVDMTPYKSTGCKIIWRTAVYETMGLRDGYGGPLTLGMCKEINQIDDLTYDWVMYDYITDSEGTNITAEDVVGMYTYAKESGLVSKMGNMESIEAVDTYTVRFTYTSDYIGVYEDMYGKVQVVSYDKFESSGDDMAITAIGTGRYVVDDYIPGSFITISKREDYWQTDESLIPPYNQANVDIIDIKIIGSLSQMAIALQTGEIDMIPYFSGSDASYFFDENNEPKEGYAGIAYLDSNILFMIVNMFNGDYNGTQMTSMLYNYKEIRQAIFYAIDAQGVLDGCGDGRGEVCHTFGSAVYGDYVSKWSDEEYWPYDPEKAKELIASSGFDTTQSIRIMAQNSSPMKDIATLIQGYMMAVGLNAELCIYDSALAQEYGNDPTQWEINICRMMSPDYEPNLWSYCMTGKTYTTINFAQYDTEAQELLETVRHPAGHTEENLDAYHKHMIDEAYVMGLYQAYQYSAAKDMVTGYYISNSRYPLPQCFTYNFG